jgi:hypothetical protein
MNKSELLSIIQSELTSNPKVTSVDIAKKHKIPLIIVEIFKRRIDKGH